MLTAPPIALTHARAAGSTIWSPALGDASAVVGGIDDIEQCISIIIETSPGEDPLRPEFGAGIWELIDRRAHTAVADIIARVTSALTRWEPRIENIDVDVIPLLAADLVGAVWSLEIKYTLVGDDSGDLRVFDWRATR